MFKRSLDTGKRAFAAATFFGVALLAIFSKGNLSALEVEGADSINAAPAVQDSEYFPLNLNLSQASAPLRSEPPSADEIEKWKTTRSKILSDFGNRMTPEFLIPQGLRERTSFWFDIYTRYGEAHHIIHHERYPWIIFKVVDTTETLVNGKGPLWLRREQAGKLVKQRAAEIRAALVRLARRQSYDHLPALDRELYDHLAGLKGSRRNVFRQASLSVRTQLGQKDFFERGLINSSRYLSYMEDEFRRAKLPIELTRLPFVESSFNEEARSKVGASGIWQIMPSTGKAYMIVTPEIDERNSPIKATNAAARLLRSYYRAMGSWPLAITSYNNGIGNIQKAIRHAQSRDLAEIIARYHQGDFRFASSNFFSCFLAALYAERYNELIFKEIPREPLMEREIVRLNRPTSVGKIVKAMGLNRIDLARYNPDIRSGRHGNVILPQGYHLHLPPGLKARGGRRGAALLAQQGSTSPSKSN